MNRAIDILTEWLDRVNAGNLEGVLSLYAEDAVLLPTFSGEIRNDTDAISRYFINISSNDKLVVELDKDSLIVQELTKDIFSLGGIYSWLLVDGNTERKFHARFTYTIDVNAQRPILHHHSSVIPKD